ncbi:MAG: helix-turn-helix domain-containing protein [Cognatishimia sp.]|uniref:GlxA family transcriptional regulator n=1 Tax=Cognatishimia sp. TaxID=2211648 RepID=UPI003B8D801E
MPVQTKTSIEIVVQDQFCDLEAASIVETLRLANQVATRAEFGWKFISDQPGLLHSRAGMIVRAEPLVFDHNLPDMLLIVGGNKTEAASWIKRLRAMQRAGNQAVLLSDAATSYIKSLKSSENQFTTHWKDTVVISEEGSFPALGITYAKQSGGVITSAGASFTTDLLLNLLSQSLSASEQAEICSLLLVKTVRSAQEVQPHGARQVTNVLPISVARAMKQMDENITDPLTTTEIAARVGVSVRQLERQFAENCGISPSRFYRKTRIKKAHALVIGTKLALIDIAMATGFASTSSLSVAFFAEFGQRPRECRHKLSRSFQ